MGSKAVSKLEEIQPKIIAGQVWREMDPRFKTRRIQVRGIGLGIAEFMNVETGRIGSADVKRFNGKRSGYGYFPEDNTDKAKAGYLHQMVKYHEIHHIDFNKDNNDPSNLECLWFWAHAIKHSEHDKPKEE